MRNIGMALLATALVVAMSYVARTATSPTPVQDDLAYEANPQLAVALPSAPMAEVPAELNRLIGVFERRTVDSRDALDFRTLGNHYSTRAAASGSIEDYQRAAAALETAYELAPTDRSGRVAYAAAASAIHQFEAALRVAEASLADSADDVDSLAIAGDAAAELGNLELASEYYEKLDLLAPDHPAVLARLAGLAHLRGDQTHAIAVAQLAYAEATLRGDQPKALAFYALLLSDLLLDAGRYDDAIAQSQAAIELDPLAGIAHASFGRALSHDGQLDVAIDAYRRALELQDDPGWRVALGDTLSATGQTEAADSQYQAAMDEYESGDETLVGHSLATLYSDLDVHVEQALALAQRELGRRQSIDTYDTLAWALYRNGRIDEARAAIDIARADGAQDANVIYHSALIAAAQGDRAHAVAELTELLDRNPGFHPLHSIHAVELLKSLTR